MAGTFTGIKKIATRTVFGDVSAIREACGGKEGKEGTKGELFTVYGVANSVKQGESNNGPWTALKGEFRAIGKDGKQYMSTTCFLPDVGLDPVVNALQANDGAQVKFAYKVIAINSPKSATGYEYGVEPIFQPKENDALGELANLIAGTLTAATPAKELPVGKQPDLVKKK